MSMQRGTEIEELRSVLQQAISFGAIGQYAVGQQLLQAGKVAACERFDTAHPHARDLAQRWDLAAEGLTLLFTSLNPLPAHRSPEA